MECRRTSRRSKRRQKLCHGSRSSPPRASKIRISNDPRGSVQGRRQREAIDLDSVTVNYRDGANIMRRRTIRRTAIVITACFVTACATPPDKISGSYVSPLQYSDYSCDQTKQELMRVNRRVVEVTGAQKKHADNDAVAMGVGLVLFWPALFFLAGGDKKDELARLKGEYDALEQAAIQKDCMIASELRDARHQREAAEKKGAHRTTEHQSGGFNL